MIIAHLQIQRCQKNGIQDFEPSTLQRLKTKVATQQQILTKHQKQSRTLRYSWCDPLNLGKTWRDMDAIRSVACMSDTPRWLKW